MPDNSVLPEDPDEYDFDLPEDDLTSEDPDEKNGVGSPEVGRVNNETARRGDRKQEEVGRVNNEDPDERLHRREVGRVNNEEPGRDVHEQEIGVVNNDSDLVTQVPPDE